MDDDEKIIKMHPKAKTKTVQGPISEDGLALRCAREFGAEFRWCPERGKWFVWDGMRWRADQIGQVFEAVRNICRGEAIATDKDKWASHRTCSAVERFMRTEKHLVAQAAEWDADPMLLGTPDGHVDLRTGEVCTPDPKALISKSTAVSPAPGEPKLWLQFLDETFGDNAKIIGFVQRVFGYCLTSDTSEQCLFFLFGLGTNGKSVAINTLRGIMGDYAVAAAMETLNAGTGSRHPTELAHLAGARLVVAVETDENQSWNESRVKALTGQDLVTARFMNRDFFSFAPGFKLLVLGNHKPVLNSVDDAIKRRFHIVPFVFRAVEIDKQLGNKLRAEWPMILQWAIAGCSDWLAEGLRVPDQVLEETAQFFDEQDVFQQWLDDHCVVARDQWEYVGKLRESCSRFMDQAGEKKVGSKAFSQLIKRKGFAPKHHTFPGPRTARLVLGLYLTSEGPKAPLGSPPSV